MSCNHIFVLSYSLAYKYLVKTLHENVWKGELWSSPAFEEV